ncbi:MAG TPA: GWxTD domain-containing protein [Candidatus Polarisedimenticolia bacterium]|nr:GWxTD domain-containing protein [Candidatus Polarisedimenticolia bacterium]
MSSEPDLTDSRSTLMQDPPRRRPVSLSAYLVARLLRLRPNHGPRPMGQVKRDQLDAPRWALTLGILLFLILFLTLIILFFVAAPPVSAASDGVNFDKPTKDWYQGPVRYIITKVETKAYKALETESERLTFIDWFWQRRDIEPSTPQNEFRDRYEQRVFEAQRKFISSATPGWKTDMGKIYILVGPPDEINSDVVAQTHRGIITWVYRRPPFPDMQPNTVIGFARDPSGEFRLSINPTIDSDVARGLKFSRTMITADQTLIRAGQVDPALLAAGATLSASQIETNMTYGRMQMLPPHEEELFKSFVSSRESYGSTIPMETRFDFYRAGDDTYTTVTVGIRSTAVQYRTRGGKEVPDVGVFGKLVSKENPELSYPLSSESGFADSPENASAGIGDLLIFQAVGAFKPGLYRAILGVEDRVSNKLSSLVKEIEVPDLTGTALRLSSITVAGSMEPTEYATSTAKPFQIGKFKIVARPDAAFSKSDELDVYFQVYGPASDPATGKPKMDVLYSFRRRAEDGTYQDVGTYRVADSPAQVQGYAVPLEKWPEGTYTLTVTIVDKVAKAQATGDAIFTIRP